MISHHAVHGALEARPESLQRFKQKAERASQGDALYAACVYDLDDAVGVVIQALRDLGIEDDTLVIFTSDNGSTPRSSQEPLRGNKGCYYEGGIREPWIAYWPGKIQPGSRVSVPVINLDLYPTFLAAAGVKIPEGKVLDGVSLLSIFTGKSEGLSRETIFWHFPGYLDDPVPRGRDPVFRTRPVTVMRSGNWKLHFYHEEWQLDGGRASLSTNNAVELYDLDRDPGERDDLAVSRPEVRDRLVGSMLAWIDSTDAKLPTERNPTYDPHTKPSREKRGKTRLDE